MPIRSRSRRGSIDFLLPIAILLIFIVGASSGSGSMGKVGGTIKKTMDKLFGTAPAPCAFLQRGALSSILNMGGEEGIIATMPVKYYSAASAISIPSGDSCPTAATGTYTFRIRSNSTGPYIDNSTATTGLICNPTDCRPQVEWIINKGTMDLLSSSDIYSPDLVSLPCDCGFAATTDYTYLCCDAKTGPCVCSQGDNDGGETTEITTGTNMGKYYCTLRFFLATEVYGLNANAASDAQFTKLASQPIPSYICIFIFGLMPFVVIYYLIQDLFAFVMVSPTTKRLLAIVIASMAIVTGAFADMTYFITKLTSISLGYSFLMLIFGTGLAAVVITNLMGLTSSASAMHRSLNEAHYGFMMLKSFGQQLESSSKKE